jgi:hypothetical protein
MGLNRRQKSILTVAAIGQLIKGNVGFEDLPLVLTKTCIFWDITSCSPLKSVDASEEYIISIFRVEE